LHIKIIAVGTKMPAWVESAVNDYSGRMPAEFALHWKEIKAEIRSQTSNAAQWMAKEAIRIGEQIPQGCHKVLLDERGKDLTTVQLSARLSVWRDQALPVAIIIGGPDGVDNSIKQAANETIKLSSLTMPHPMVRVLLAEQLYRAWSIMANHPYHRA
jgi:23S rRNA (pseudouridine1915-N3)-methyltransferase